MAYLPATVFFRPKREIAGTPSGHMQPSVPRPAKMACWLAGRTGMLEIMRNRTESDGRQVNLLRFFWPIARGVLPYPDFLRRARIRRQAYRLVTCTTWPEGNETGSDAAQLALLRLLSLQKRVRRAALTRSDETAAVHARASYEACVVGLYCLHSRDAVTELIAANNRAAGRVVSYLTADGMMSKEAIEAAVDELGEQGRDPNLRNWAEWLEHEKDIPVAELYLPYYAALSHFFVHTNAFTLTRHVGPKNKLRRNPAYPWARRSAAHLADMCTGLLAGEIARQNNAPDQTFNRYLTAHAIRMVTPAAAMAAKTTVSNAQWHHLPAALRDVRALRRYINGQGRADPPDQQEARVRAGMTRVLTMFAGDNAPETFAQVISELTDQVLAEMATARPQAPSASAAAQEVPQ